MEAALRPKAWYYHILMYNNFYSVQLLEAKLFLTFKCLCSQHFNVNVGNHMVTIVKFFLSFFFFSFFFYSFKTFDKGKHKAEKTA